MHIATPSRMIRILIRSKLWLWVFLSWIGCLAALSLYFSGSQNALEIWQILNKPTWPSVPGHQSLDEQDKPVLNITREERQQYSRNLFALDKTLRERWVSGSVHGTLD